MQNTTSRGW